jgi:hypothetical protein
MSLREAAQQALEALKIEQAALEYEYGKVEHIDNAITALRTALAEPEQEFVCSTGLCRYRKTLTDEEIELLAVKHAPPIDPAFAQHDDFIEFARAIERAHGIGGEA